MKQSKNLEIKNIDIIGYGDLFIYNEWKVSMLSYLDELRLENIKYVEKHTLTDEIFYLIEGCCTLIIANIENDKIIDFELVKLDKNKIYNVKKDAYHHHVLSCDAKVLIIENTNTSNENSIKHFFNKEEKILLKNTWEKKL